VSEDTDNEDIFNDPADATTQEPDTAAVEQEHDQAVAVEQESDFDYVPPDLAITGLGSLRGIFLPPVAASPQRIIRMVNRFELKRAAEHFGLEADTQNWLRTYETLFFFFKKTQFPSPPECDCDTPLTGLRWLESDNGEPVTVYIDSITFTARQVRLIYQALAILQSICGIEFLVVDSFEEMDSLNIYIDMGDIDGRGNTLGVTRYFDTGTGFLNSSSAIDLWIRMDQAEPFFSDRYFLAVMLHELGHGCGLDHIQDINEIMNARLVRLLTEATPQFIDQLVQRFGTREAA
jgi:hypothetical protein